MYREDIFYGKGKDITECTRNELTTEMEERESENVLAYRGNDVRDGQVKVVKDVLS